MKKHKLTPRNQEPGVYDPEFRRKQTQANKSIQKDFETYLHNRRLRFETQVTKDIQALYGRRAKFHMILERQAYPTANVEIMKFILEK